MKPEIFILKNKQLEVHISTFGATLTRMITDDRNGNGVDVILGMERPEDYESAPYAGSGAYLGAVIGRYANRIAGGKFTLDGKAYQLAVNNGANHLHGGCQGFDKKLWMVTEHNDVSLSLRYISPDGEENYPGNLTVDVCFSIEQKELKISYKAVADQKCYVNLTHHPYFNLAPAEGDIRGHLLKLYTDKYLQTKDLIPDGNLLTVSGAYDFTSPAALGEVIDKCGGLDDCFVFGNNGQFTRLAELYAEKTGIKLYVCSDYPGLQVYTGRYLDVRGGKGGVDYGPYTGVALEAQFWPDSPNHPGFPSALLQPGEEYARTTVYGFE